jgi:hypothetical protein
MNSNSIGGELAFKIDKIIINRPGDKFHDLTFKTADGNYLHICGENNMVELLENAIKTYREEELIRKVQKAMANNAKPIF